MSSIKSQYPEMSAFHSFELLDPFSSYRCRNLLSTSPRFFSSFHSSLAHAVELEKDYLDFEFDVLYPSSVSVDLSHSYCLHPHYHRRHYRHQYHPFLLSFPSADFFDAAKDLIFRNLPEAELYVRSLGDRLDTLELGLNGDFGSYIGAPEGKWKWTAEIKGKKGEGIGQTWECTAETKEKSMRWTVEYQGMGKYSFHAASASAQDDWERGKKEKKEKRAKARTVEITEGTDQQVVSKRQASVKRTAHTSKNKNRELSPQEAAMAIQKTFRDHMLRRSLALHSFRDLAVAKSKLREIRALFSSFSYRHRISRDAEERQRFSEKVIILLLTVDAIEGQDLMVRSAKRSMTRELEAMLEVVDSHPHRDGGSRRPKFDLPLASFPADFSSGVADVLRMLDQEDGSGRILPDFSL